MLVLWDHREPRGPELAGRLKSFKALEGVFPPMRWQIVFSGLRLVFFFVLFVMLFLCHISWAFPLWSFSSHSQMADSVAILMSDALVRINAICQKQPTLGVFWFCQSFKSLFVLLINLQLVNLNIYSFVFKSFLQFCFWKSSLQFVFPCF